MRRGKIARRAPKRRCTCHDRSWKGDASCGKCAAVNGRQEAHESSPSRHRPLCLRYVLGHRFRNFVVASCSVSRAAEANGASRVAEAEGISTRLRVQLQAREQQVCERQGRDLASFITRPPDPHGVCTSVQVYGCFVEETYGTTSGKLVSEVTYF